MRMPHALVIAAALVAAAILARSAWSTLPTSSMAMGIVVAACGTPVTSAMFPYTNATQNPLTLDPGGELCVNK